MSDDFAVQLSIKTPRDSLLNLRAASTEEFEKVAAWALSNSARFIDLETAVKGVPQALAGNVTHVQVQPNNQGYQRQATDENGEPLQRPTNEPPAGPAPSCVHGPRNYKSGTIKNGKNAGRQWQAWDCQQNVCEREWVR